MPGRLLNPSLRIPVLDLRLVILGLTTALEQDVPSHCTYDPAMVMLVSDGLLYVVAGSSPEDPF